jgi:aspartate/methionine/tyrosine aminotransferase
MIRVQSQVIGNPHTISQHAALAALKAPIDPARRVSLDARRKLIVSELAAVKDISFPVPRGAFYVFISVERWMGRSFRGQTITSSAQLANILLKDLLLAVVPGEAFGVERHIRLTYTVSEDHIRRGVQRLAEFSRELR